MAVGLFPKGEKAQSAIEYLITYSWAILIVAVVLGVFFALGLLNISSIGPRAQAGSCLVQRPYGSGTTSFVNLVGVCSNQLPKFVAEFNGKSSLVEGQISPLIGGNDITVTAWVELFSLPSSNVGGIFQYGSCDASEAVDISSNGNLYFDRCGSGLEPGLAIPTVSQWFFVAFTTNDTGDAFYLNGNSQAVGADTGFPITSGDFFIGQDTQSSYNSISGEISNVQLYDRALSSNDITYLYMEGIGGVPLDLKSLVGWWQLDGNADDYSGNNQTTISSNILYLSNWINGYKTP